MQNIHRLHSNAQDILKKTQSIDGDFLFSTQNAASFSTFHDKFTFLAKWSTETDDSHTPDAVTRKSPPWKQNTNGSADSETSPPCFEIASSKKALKKSVKLDEGVQWTTPLSDLVTVLLFLALCSLRCFISGSKDSRTSVFSISLSGIRINSNLLLRAPRMHLSQVSLLLKPLQLLLASFPCVWMRISPAVRII